MIKQSAVIVVADDDPSINTIIRMTLEYDGYRVLSCITSADAWQVAARVRPDLVITDMHMEIRDAGWRLLDHLRADPTTGEIAVLVCSGDIDMLTQRTDELRQHGGQHSTQALRNRRSACPCTSTPRSTLTVI